LSSRDAEFLDDVKKDFRVFVFIIWKHLNLPDPTPIQYDIASYLQNGDNRIVIEAFRGIGKSWITSAFALWVLLNNPQKKIMIVSASKERADAFSTFTRRLIDEVPILQHLIPTRKQRDSKISFDVAPARTDHSPSVKSVGITGQLTGSRADIIIADDVETPNTSLTQTMRDRLFELVKEFEAILKPDTDARIIFLGTPQVEMSLYNKMQERGYTARVWTARYLPAEGERKYNGTIAPYISKLVAKNEAIVGTSTEPTRFTDEDLTRREITYGKAGFALQFMLDTSLSDADKYPLKLKDLMVMDCATSNQLPADLSWGTKSDLVVQDVPVIGLDGDKYYRPFWTADTQAKPSGGVLAIDPSGMGKDETAYAVIKYLNGFLYLVEAGGLVGGYDEKTLNTLALAAKRHQVTEVITERNFGDGMFDKLLSPYLTRIYPVPLNAQTKGVGVRHNTQKEKRVIDTLEPVMMQHKLVVDTQVITDDYEIAKDAKSMKYSLFYQMTRITSERGALAHDDRLEAVAMAVAYWVEVMDADSRKIAADYKEEQLDAALEKFMNNAGSSSRNTGVGYRI